MSRAVVAGVGMIPFTTPRKTETYDAMSVKATTAALADAGVAYEAIQQAYVGYVYGDSTSGQAALYPFGVTGIPIINVNNNCSTGSTALYLARQAVEHGVADVVLALGFEQMRTGALSLLYDDRPTPMAPFDVVVDKLQDRTDAPFAAQFFGGAGREYCEKYGADPNVFAQIAVKSRRHAAHNPYAVFRDPITLDDVVSAPHIYGPLTRLMCCPPTCGAAAAVLMSEDYAQRHGVSSPVVIAAQEMTTDFDATFDTNSMMNIVGFDMANRAAQAVYEKSGVGPEDVHVVELHDCFTTNEVVAYEALGLTPEGTAEKFITDGDNTYGGRVVANPSGGLMSKGHPLGATGLAQCAELVWQLRGQAGERQVNDAHVALQHNIGLGGAAVVTMYERLG
jgi:sterol carrier protein 2